MVLDMRRSQIFDEPTKRERGRGQGKRIWELIEIGRQTDSEGVVSLEYREWGRRDKCVSRGCWCRLISNLWMVVSGIIPLLLLTLFICKRVVVNNPPKCEGDYGYYNVAYGVLST